MKDRNHIHISIDTESIPLLSVHPRSGSTCLYKCSHTETRGRFFVICYQEYSFCSKPHKVTCLLINFLCINENDFHFSHFHLKIIVIGMFTLIKFTMRNPPLLVLYICYSWQAHLSGIGLLPVYFQLLSSILLLFPEVKTHYEFYFNKYLSFAWPSHKGSLWWCTRKPHSHSPPGRTSTCPPPWPSMRRQDELRTRVQACAGERVQGRALLGPRRLHREGMRETPGTGLLYCLSRLLYAHQCPCWGTTCPTTSSGRSTSSGSGSGTPREGQGGSCVAAVTVSALWTMWLIIWLLSCPVTSTLGFVQCLPGD